METFTQDGLAASIQARSAPRPETVQRWAAYAQSIRAKGAQEARQSSSQATYFVSAAGLFRQFHDALPDDAIRVDEVCASSADEHALLRLGVRHAGTG